MLINNLHFENYKNYTINSLVVDSASLKTNKLQDPAKRVHPLLLPKDKGAYHCVVYLSGFAGDGIKNFNFKPFEDNFISEIDEWTTTDVITPKIFLFINAWTFWGGSQFINSDGCGNYEDMIVKDVLPNLASSLKDYSIKDYVVMGGSSGGYGALHLSSKYPEIFNHCIAIAPDSGFEVSLKPEIYHAFADIDRCGGVRGVYELLKSNELKTNTKSFFTMINVLAMAACYSKVDDFGMPILPLRKEGDFDNELWDHWLRKDPIHFLKNRFANLKKLKTLFLSVGEFDQFLLQYGVRQIRKILIENDIEFIYEEFKGNHFDIGTRRKKALSVV